MIHWPTPQINVELALQVDQLLTLFDYQELHQDVDIPKAEGSSWQGQQCCLC